MTDYKELDIAGLYNQARRNPQSAPETTAEYNNTTDNKNALKRSTEPHRGIQEKEGAAELEKEAYMAYQRNIKAAGQILAEILIGARRAEDIHSLFLKAVKAISLMTGDSVFYTQLEGDIKAIYGEGLLEPYPLQIELEAVQGRLQRLREAIEREPAPTRGPIAAAIKAHEQRAEQIQNLIQRNERESTKA